MPSSPLASRSAAGGRARRFPTLPFCPLAPCSLAPCSLAPRPLALRPLLLCGALLAAAGCSPTLSSSNSPSWEVPNWPSRGFSAPSDARPPWLPVLPERPPRYHVPDDGFRDRLALL